MKNGGRIPAAPVQTTLNTNETNLMMKKNPPKGNIKTEISVNPEDIADAERIEDDPDAMLRLIDILFFLKDEELPS